LHRNGRLDVVGYSPHNGNHENAWVQQFQPYGALAAEGSVNPNGVVAVAEVGLAEQSGVERRRMMALGMTGKQFDPDTGLYYFGFRWYSPEMMRWTQKEPAGLDGPNMWHFVAANPVGFLDLEGLETGSSNHLNCLGFACGSSDAIYPDKKNGESMKETMEKLGYKCKKLTGPARDCKCPRNENPGDKVVVYIYAYQGHVNSDPWTDPWRGPKYTQDSNGKITPVEVNDYHAVMDDPATTGDQDWAYFPGNYEKHVRFDPKNPPVEYVKDPDDQFGGWPTGPEEPDPRLKHRYCCCRNCGE